MAVKDALLAVKRTYLDNESISNKEQLGFAGGIFGNAMGQDSVDTFADKFNRNFMGLTNDMLLIKDNITTVLGFFIPPLAGTLYDIPSKPGKRSHLRTALLVTPIPFAVTSMLLFVVPTGNSFYNLIWTLFFNILFSVADAFYDIAMNALGLKLVSDPADRKKFFTFESISSTLGSMFPGGVIPIFVGMTDDAHKKQLIYFFMALGFCIIGIATMYAPYMTIKERVSFREAVAEEKGEKIKWDKHTVSAIVHNRPFMIVQAASILETVRQITFKLLPYLYEDCFDDFGMKAVIDAISGSLSYVGLLAVPFVGKKISARTMLLGGYSYTAFFYLIMTLFNIRFDLKRIRHIRYLPGLCIGFAGVPNAAMGAAKRIMTADSTDYMEWYSEKKYGTALRSDGLLSAAQNIVGKINALLKTNLYNNMFKLIGYKTKDPNSDITPVQSSRTLHGIYIVSSVCGLVGNLLPAVCYLFDSFDGEKKEQIYTELVELRQSREKIMSEDIVDEN